MTFRHTLPVILVAVMAAGLPEPVRAATSKEYPFSFTFTVLAPVCTVTGTSNETSLEVPFGMQGTLAVNTAETERTLNMKVSCNGPTWSGKALKMRFTPGSQGTISVGGKTVLGTNMTDLGIEIRYNGAVIAPGELTWHEITGINTSASAPSGTVPLTFRLVSDDVYALKAEDFSATATVAAQYD